MATTDKKKFEDKYPFLYDAAIIAVGVVLGGTILMVGTHFAKPLIASAMGTKKTTTAPAAAASAPAATEVTAVTQTM